jgi:TPP-dependent pyruvate/acetoin dehydrogenase alpha subunit
LEPFTPSDLELALFIRHFELTLLEHFAKGNLGGTTHTCIGQEYIPVAMRTLLLQQDFIFSNHRGHGHYIAYMNDAEGLLAELMGRQGAICNGVGGSQHVYREHRYLSTGVQGESLPVATGVALHLRRTNAGALALVHIGDGTWGEGAVYEALNIAQLWKLPLLVVVENNKIAQTTPIEQQMAGSIEQRAQAFGTDYIKIRSIHPDEIRRTLADLILVVRRHNRPLVIEFDTERLGPHSKGDDTRDTGTIRSLNAKGWYVLQREAVRKSFDEIEVGVVKRVQQLFVDVAGRPLAEWHCV